MLDVTKLFLNTKITKPLSIQDGFMYVNPAIVAAWTPADGAYYYALIENGVAREIVRVTGYLAGKGLIIDRGQDNTHPVSFPSGACVNVVWNPQQLLDFLEGRQKPLPQIKPDTYCLDCNTCIKIEADGTISEVIGSQSC